MPFQGHPPTEEQFAISRLKQGDILGLEPLVRSYQVQAVHLALLIVHDRDLAEEIVQSCFLRAVEKINQFDDQRPFKPWFLRIVANAAVQECQRNKRFISLEGSEAGQVQLAEQFLVDPAQCTEDLVENAELYDAMWKALDRLAPEQRAALVLRYLHGYSEADLTSHFSQPLSTIKWWLRAARSKLQKILQKESVDMLSNQEQEHE